MDKLNEEIDRVLSESLLEEGFSPLFEEIVDPEGEDNVEALIAWKNRNADWAKLASSFVGEKFKELDDLQIGYYELDPKVLKESPAAEWFKGKKKGIISKLEAKDFNTAAFLTLGEAEKWTEQVKKAWTELGKPMSAGEGKAIGRPLGIFRTQLKVWLDIHDIADKIETQWMENKGLEGEPEAAKTEPEEKEEPQVRISTDLEVGADTGVRIIGGLRSVADPVDTKIYKSLLNDRRLALGQKTARQYAKLIKNFSIHLLAKEGSRLNEADEEETPEEKEARAEKTREELKKRLKPMAQQFSTWLDTKLAPAFEDSHESGHKELDKFIHELETSNKKSLKDKKIGRRVSKHYIFSQKLSMVLANALTNFLHRIKPAPTAPGEKKGEEEVTKTGETETEKPKAGAEGAVSLNEDKLVEIVIDFNDLRKKQLNESFLAMFGGWVEHILKAMFGGLDIPVKIRGEEREVQSFATAIASEKRYIDVAKKYGLDHPSTYKSKAQLDAASKSFERETGLKWPFK